MAFSAEEILEEFVEASRTRETITSEARHWETYQLILEAARERGRIWRMSPANRALDAARNRRWYRVTGNAVWKKLRMERYLSKPEVKERYRAVTKAYRESPEHKEKQRAAHREWWARNKDRLNAERRAKAK
jgi:hypothetical protein